MCATEPHGPHLAPRSSRGPVALRAQFVDHHAMIRLVCAVVLAACGSTAAAPTARAPREQAADVGSVGLVWQPSSREMRTVSRDDDRTLVLAGPWRAEITADGITISRERTAMPIAGATRDEGGWIFRTVDGVIATAPTFLGDLEAAGQVPLYVEEAPAAAGTMVLTRREADRVWIVDRRGVETVTPNAGPILDAVFVSPTFGALRTWGGRVAITNDRGRTFRFHPLGEHAASSLRPGEGAIEVIGSNGTTLLHEDGRVEAVPSPDAAEPEPLALSPIETEALAREILAHDAITRAAMPLMETEICEARGVMAVRTGGGLVARVGAGFVRFDARGDWEDLPLPELECPVLHAIGGRAVVRDGASREVRLLALDGDRWEELPLDVERACAFVASDDRTHVVYREDCSTYSAPYCTADMRSGATSCTSNDNGGRIVSAHHGIPLIYSSDVPGFYVLYPEEAGAFDYVGCEEGDAECEGPRLDTVGAAGWHPNGELIARSDGFFRGRPGEDMRRLALPEGARGVAFGSRGNGVAFGRGRLWLSEDDGASWRPPATSFEGLLHGPQNRGLGARCDATGCYIETGLWVTGFREPRIEPALRAETTDERPPSEPLVRGVRFDCQPIGDVQRIAGDVQAGRGVIETPAIRVEWSATGRGASRVERLTWSAYDGLVDGRGGLIGAAARIEQDDDVRAWFEPIAATALGLLVDRCTHEDECHRHFVAHGRPSPAELTFPAEREARVWADVTRVLVFEEDYQSRVIEHAIGRRTLRWLALDPSEVTFARVGDEVRLLDWSAPEGRLRSFEIEPPIDREAFQEIDTPVDVEALAICEVPTARPTEEWQYLLDGWVALLERRDAVFCIRTLETRRAWLTARGGALEGWQHYEEGERQRVRCTMSLRED
jgi:hypothetical protein